MKQLTSTLAKHKVMALFVTALLLVGTSSFLTAKKAEKKEGSGKGYLGINIERMSHEDKEEFGVKFGILVTRVLKDDAAEKAGIKKYDVIQYFNGERVRRPWDLTEAVRESKPGSKATIKIIREGKEKTVQAVLGEAKNQSMFFPRSSKGFNWIEKGDHPKSDHKSFLYKFGDGDEEHFVIKGFGGAFLGVNLSPVSEGLGSYFGVKANGGALVMQVEKDSPAQKGGILDGDVIVRLGDKDITGPKDVVKLLAEKKKDEKVDVVVMRQKKKKTLKVELAERKGFGNFHIMGDHLKDIDIRVPSWHMEVPSVHGHCDGDVIFLEKKDGDKIIHKRIKIKRDIEDVEKEVKDM